MRRVGWKASAILTSLPLVAYGIWGLNGPAHAQMVREHNATLTRGFHGQQSRIRRSFQSDAEAREVFIRILNAAGLAGMQDRISIRASAETPNAEAAIEKNERIIFYNAVFMESVRAGSKDYWSQIAVLAHELGHHIRLHTVIDGRNHEFELEADYQAGFILRRMGASLEQAQQLFLKIGTEEATKTHPARAQRVQAVTLGWKDGAAAPAEAAAKGATVAPSGAEIAAAISRSEAQPAAEPSIRQLALDCVRSVIHPDRAIILERVASLYKPGSHTYGWKFDEQVNAADAVAAPISGAAVKDGAVEISYGYQRGRLVLIPVALPKAFLKPRAADDEGPRPSMTRGIAPPTMREEANAGLYLEGLWIQNNGY
ncbi:MAG: hypothetical protein JSS20_14220, partial [Proteobacteria bacterium]|nr:hypothetical protein [Pseudomonadota bacterium]